MAKKELWKSCSKCGTVYMHPSPGLPVCTPCWRDIGYDKSYRTNWSDPFWNCPKCGSYNEERQNRCNCGFSY